MQPMIRSFRIVIALRPRLQRSLYEDRAGNGTSCREDEEFVLTQAEVRSSFARYPTLPGDKTDGRGWGTQDIFSLRCFRYSSWMEWRG